ncbi:MAG TPA: acyl-ACP thioesterase domain-containing protein [Sporolactobacillaceae bacterium]|nr:acyl-ACP thioesterase domain-containing protein [Sporolactobacillaceae bacterium]
MESGTSFFKANYHIELRDVDFTKELKLSTLFSYFQDTASLASEALGCGIETLKETHGVAWVLTRIYVEILRHPILDEVITIETWPLEPGKLEFDRDFFVRDANGKVIIKAVSKWVIMDLKERKLKRSDAIGIHYPVDTAERAIEGKLRKLKDFGHPEVVYNKVIGYSDIDFNGHLNNSRFVDYIMDCFSIEDHKTQTIHTLDLNFIQEALPGESITINKDTSKMDEKFIYIEGINQTRQTLAFKSLILIDSTNKLQ